MRVRDGTNGGGGGRSEELGLNDGSLLVQTRTVVGAALLADVSGSFALSVLNGAVVTPSTRL